MALRKACCTPTLRGNVCDGPAFDDLPCCYNHVPHWVAANFANLRRFVTARALRVGRVYMTYDSTRIIVDVHKRRGPPIVHPRVHLRHARPAHSSYQPVHGFTALRLHADDAAVLADLLGAHGNDHAATLILQTIES